MSEGVEALSRFQLQLTRAGHRRLLVVSGDDEWAQQQALTLCDTLAGDWLWVGNNAPVPNACAPQALSNLLGREHLHAVFDARYGFDVAALAALCGTLRAGSLLVLLTPALTQWPSKPDQDAVRWSDSAEPIATPRFVQHFCRHLAADPQVLLWQQGDPLILPDLPSAIPWQPASGEPQREQAQILERLLTQPPGITAVTAPRGRGKSALAGMLLQRITGSAIVTAPSRGATDVIAHFADKHFHFMAPDALLASGRVADWLIVDEAAAIPGPLLEQLVSRFPRVLLTTTVQGYEGTGRGFLLKFCARFAGLRYFPLSEPMRWAVGCPLERFIDEVLLFDDRPDSEPAQGEVRFLPLEPEAWLSAPARPSAVYKLLCAAHYRTSPLDLRRMMDAPGQHFTVACTGDRVTGAVWLVDEGGLAPGLSRAVWAGYRRPRGNLVAQSLAAHGGSPLAATLSGRRITRVAVHPGHQRQGLGQALIASAAASATVDYLSVSFGYTEELWRFWQRCGFVLVRIGSHREASSGCYSAMAIRPLSDAGRALCAHEHQRLRRDARIIERWNGEKIPVETLESATLTDDDWLELAGFAWGHRPFSASVGSLTRLLNATSAPLEALRGKIELQVEEGEMSRRLGLNGRKALLARLRAETGQTLVQRDLPRSQQLKNDILQWQFFQ